MIIVLFLNNNNYWIFYLNNYFNTGFSFHRKLELCWNMFSTLFRYCNFTSSVTSKDLSHRSWNLSASVIKLTYQTTQCIQAPLCTVCYKTIVGDLLVAGGVVTNSCNPTGNSEATDSTDDVAVLTVNCKGKDGVSNHSIYR